MATISGEIRDANGDLAANRIIRAYRRDTGALLVSGTSGNGGGATGDAHWSNTKLLLPLTSNFTDISSSPKTVTTYGGITVGASGATFDGVNDYFTVQNSTDINDFGTGDYTIEMFLKPQAASVHVVLDCTSDFECAFSMVLTNVGASTGNIEYAFGDFTTINSAANAIHSNAEYHIAFCRASGTTRMFVNGVVSGTPSSYSVAIDYQDALFVGIARDNNFPYKGTMRGFRITKGFARYTSNFTPPSLPLAFGEPVDDTGLYSLSTTYTGEVQVIALDDDEGAVFNDLILRTTPV